MSECRDCGATIVWAKQLNGRWSRPLEAVIVVDPDLLIGKSIVYDGVVRPAILPTFYVEHFCAAIENRPEANWVGTRTGVVTVDPEAPPIDRIPYPLQASALSVQCPYCGVPPWTGCRKPDGVTPAPHLHADRTRLLQEPERQDVGPFARGPWPPVPDLSRRSPWRAMRHFLFDHSSLLTDLSTAPALDPLMPLNETPSPTSLVSGSAEAAGSPARPSSKERSTSEDDSRGSPGEGSQGTADTAVVFRTGRTEPDSARTEGYARPLGPDADYNSYDYDPPSR